MDKFMGFALQLAAAGLFVVAGAAASSANNAAPLLLMLPAGLVGFGGLLLWSREPKKPAAPTPAPPPQRPAELGPDQILRLREAIATLQEDVSKLREDRDFFQQLYAGERGLEAHPPRISAPPR